MEVELDDLRTTPSIEVTGSNRIHHGLEGLWFPQEREAVRRTMVTLGGGEMFSPVTVLPSVEKAWFFPKAQGRRTRNDPGSHSKDNSVLSAPVALGLTGLTPSRRLDGRAGACWGLLASDGSGPGKRFACEE